MAVPLAPLQALLITQETRLKLLQSAIDLLQLSGALERLALVRTLVVARRGREGRMLRDEFLGASGEALRSREDLAREGAERLEVELARKRVGSNLVQVMPNLDGVGYCNTGLLVSNGSFLGLRNSFIHSPVILIGKTRSSASRAAVSPSTRAIAT